MADYSNLNDRYIETEFWCSKDKSIESPLPIARSVDSSNKMHMQLLFLSLIYLMAAGCTDKCEINDFRFIKLGSSEVLSSFYLQSNICENTMIIVIHDITDDVDTTTTINSRKYKMGLPINVKQTIVKFIEYSRNKQNGLIDNAEFKGGAIYNGGIFLVYYTDNRKNEHYFYYALTHLSSSAKQLHDELISYYYKELSFQGSESSIRINTDSIVLALEKKPGMENIPLPPPRVEPPPFRK